MNYAIIIPESWLDDLMKSKAGWINFPSSCFFIYHQELDLTRLKANPSIKLQLSENNIAAVLWILPRKFSDKKHQKKWPKLIQKSKSQVFVNSLIFADSWNDCSILFEQYFNSVDKYYNRTSVSCQYEPAYTTLLGDWDKSGALSFHPGDFFKEEFLEEIKRMSGNWVYFGHGEGDRLRGYGHLEKLELLQNGPSKPLNSTLWFTCSTLQEKKGSSLAFSWFSENNTFCLLASAHKVKTVENQAISSSWLDVILNEKELTIADILLKIYSKAPDFFSPILNQYQLLGFPWVKMGI
ncbi:hypothetical protein [Algoriphagus pacificus]|uniref:CHAT domain-containing protein n=1 Tax=Algoriphagus pacificus TaxID=2811234 RepID=A0ABS3CJ19_9BACT|nr:hypothetical protein [Algoriphagus pacificus]MBN7816151.1 hypothetical protein [Algoriphagus pacificus]